MPQHTAQSDLAGNGPKADAGNEDTWNKEEGPPIQCVVPAFPEAGGCSDKAVEVEPVAFYIGDAVGDGGVAVEVAALEGKADGVDEVAGAGGGLAVADTSG